MLSHETAAHQWGLRPRPDLVHVTLPDRDGRRAEPPRPPLPDRNARRRETPWPSPDHPARTLLDLAETLPLAQLERATAEAEVRRLIRPPDLLTLVERAPGRQGTRALRAVLGQGPSLTRSQAEQRLLDLIRRAGLPRPETNVRVEGFEVDVLWREQRLVVEVDGYAFHSSRSAFQRDRRRDAALAARGLRVIRISWRQLVTEPLSVAATLAAVLAS